MTEPRAGPGATAPLEPLLRVSAALATRDPRVIRLALTGVVSWPSSEVDEVILQAHLFIGFPDALEALAQWREIGRNERPAVVEGEAGGWESRGREVCSRVYGGNYERLRQNVAALHPDLDGWMVVGGYGRVLGRPGLDLVTRELCIAALLAVWGMPRQLHSHLRGALNAGAATWQVDEAVRVASELLDPPTAAGVRCLWHRIRDTAASAAGDGSASVKGAVGENANVS
jgi:4-carboxymuconolactone decarboxylase